MEPRASRLGLDEISQIRERSAEGLSMIDTRRILAHLEWQDQELERIRYERDMAMDQLADTRSAQ